MTSVYIGKKIIAKQVVKHRLQLPKGKKVWSHLKKFKVIKNQIIRYENKKNLV